VNPPMMAGWNLALRFGLEIAALAGIGLAAWHATSGAIRWLAVIVAPLTAAVIWGVFNVLNDPSRSGEAPVEVTGAVRIAIELAILGAGVLAVAYAGHPVLAAGFATLVVVQYATSRSRIEWLLGT
jgi:hypothetical protein